jgi:organic radical activating enzyme
MIQANSSLGKALDHRKYYRMPWTVTDNAMSWLEVTTKCNITCRGCYRDPRKDGHKSLDQIRQELEVFQDNRKSDGMSIAGGDPLVHPDIIEIVRLVRKAGYKPLVNTNGRALTPELLHKLRKAGASSFTFHVDTTQTRKDFPDTQSEETNNALRQKFADMLYREGGVTCGFNTTIHQQNLEEIPAMVRWAQENADRVHSFHFIPYRDFGIAKEFEIFAHGVRIDTEGGAGNPEYITPGPVTVQDVADQIRKADPAFAPSAYLGGNVDPKSLKWTFASRFVLKGKTLGYAGPRFMELTQQGKHLFTGTWYGLTTPSSQAAGRSVFFLLGLFDRGVMRSAWNYFKSVLRNPLNLFRRVRMQTLLLLQPTDILEDGQMNMCDGCPDMTVHEGKLYWSCRLEEIKEHGTFLHAVPKNRSIPDCRKRFYPAWDKAPSNQVAEEVVRST